MQNTIDTSVAQETSNKERKIMKSILAKDSGSIGIRKHFDPNTELTRIGSSGSGDSEVTLWQDRMGHEVIETNSDPVFECEDGFEELKETVLEGV